MGKMKRILLLMYCAGAWLGAAELSGIHAVYLLSMPHGLDQYLANRLTNNGVFQVVTDPKLADAFFTDRIGEAFEQKLAGLLPAPPEPAKSSEANTSGGKGQTAPGGNALITDTVNKLDNPAMRSSFGGAKGTIFLVGAKSHLVVWSMFESLDGSDSKQLDHAASDIVTRLQRDLKKQ
jgi:hypothetical protein